MGGVVDDVGTMHHGSASVFLPRITTAGRDREANESWMWGSAPRDHVHRAFCDLHLDLATNPGRLGFGLSCLSGDCVPTTPTVSRHHGQLHADRGERELLHRYPSQSQDC